MLEQILKQIVIEKKQQGISKVIILNFLREYIQYLVLSLIYNHKSFKFLLFKGGSCLRICFGLPRLSEDLDFDYGKEIFKKKLLPDLDALVSKEIRSKYFPPLETKIQSDVRLYLKFPILKRLDLAQASESDKLYVKIEVDKKIIPFAKSEITPISKFGFNFIVRHYDRSTLMVGKINAILYRLWFKGKKDEIDIKGRDFYDLYWYLKQGVKPNWKALRATTRIANEKELQSLLLSRIQKVFTAQKLNYDLKNFFSDQEFVADFSRNYLQIVKKYFTA